MKTLHTYYTGRKAKVGGICFDEDRMRVFVGYSPCCKGKVIMTLDEARQFANRYATEVNKHKVRKLLKAKIKLEV